MKHNLLKNNLDQLVQTYGGGYVNTDPVQVPHRYRDPADIELSGFIAAVFSYGRVDLFLPKINQVMGMLENSPAESLAGDLWEHSPALKNFYYRFQKSDDLFCLLLALRGVYADYGSLKNMFLKHYDPADETVLTALYEFALELRRRLGLAMTGKSPSSLKAPVKLPVKLPQGLSHLIPEPGKGAMKRLNMFLRWMVRKDRIDFGIWKEVKPSQLIIPLDTHIQKMAANLGLCRSFGAGIKTALEITKNLKEFSPDDPVQYDFALTRIGMLKCFSSSPPECDNCLLGPHCRKMQPENIRA